MSKQKTFLSFLIIAGLIGLTGYLIWLSDNLYQGVQSSQKEVLTLVDTQSALATKFAGMYHETQIKFDAVNQYLASTKKLLAESQQSLASLRQELELNKNIIAQAHDLLAQIKEGKIDPKSIDVAAIQNIDIQQMANKEDQLRGSLSELESKNKNLSDEIERLKNELSRYEGNIENIDSGKNILSLLRNRIQQVKSGIHTLRNQAQEARVYALRERDKARLALGNNGYLIKDGQTVRVDLAKYEAASPESILEASKVRKKIGIDVTFFK